MNNEIRRGDIFYIERFGTQAGCEQRSGRPGIVVSNDLNNKYSETVEVVYLTSAPKKDLPTHVAIRSATRDSTALCEQVTTISVDRLTNFVARCTTQELEEVDKAIMISLGIKDCGELCSRDTLTRIETERDMYRGLYMDLLSRILPQTAQKEDK